MVAEKDEADVNSGGGDWDCTSAHFRVPTSKVSSAGARNRLRIFITRLGAHSISECQLPRGRNHGAAPIALVSVKEVDEEVRCLFAASSS